MCTLKIFFKSNIKCKKCKPVFSCSMCKEIHIHMYTYSTNKCIHHFCINCTNKFNINCNKFKSCNDCVSYIMKYNEL